MHEDGGALRYASKKLCLVKTDMLRATPEIWSSSCSLNHLGNDTEVASEV